MPPIFTVGNIHNSYLLIRSAINFAPAGNPAVTWYKALEDRPFIANGRQTPASAENFLNRKASNTIYEGRCLFHEVSVPKRVMLKLSAEAGVCRPSGSINNTCPVGLPTGAKFMTSLPSSAGQNLLYSFHRISRN